MLVRQVANIKDVPNSLFACNERVSVIGFYNGKNLITFGKAAQKSPDQFGLKAA